MARPHWSSSIAHFDEQVPAFVQEYFGEARRRCLLVAAAGFDPRSRRIAEILSVALRTRLKAVFVREERGKPDAALLSAADANEAKLRMLVPDSHIVKVDVFSDDDAPVAGARIAKALAACNVGPEITDVVFDMSALSIGVGFPAAKLLLERCETDGKLAFHVMLVSNPELDDQISSEPSGRAMAVRGFAGEDISSSALSAARIWVPHLAKGKTKALDEIGRSIGQWYKVCPVLPFPARDPRRADALMTEYRAPLTDEWQVDPRDVVYASERNPLDTYRTLSLIAERHKKAVEGVFAPSIVVSPLGSKVLAVGALMAAIEHDLTVQYVETIRYEFRAATTSRQGEPDDLVHILLSGPAYGDFGRAIGAAQ